MNENQLAEKLMYYRKKKGLSNDEKEKPSTQPEPSMGKAPWIFIGISALCILVYIIGSNLMGTFRIGMLICMFILCVPIQLFLHIYFSNAIKNNSFSGIAGFDDKIAYNICEVKKMLIQIDLHIGILSTVYVFLLCVINGIDLKMKWFEILLVLYFFNFIIAIEINNYKIYRNEDDKKRAKRSMPITVIYSLLLCKTQKIIF